MLNKSIIKQVREVLKEQPDLEFYPETGFLSGQLIVDVNDKYFVDIDLNAFPLRFPTVWETGERIPKTKDRHIYDDTQSCCFTTSAKEQILLNTNVRSLQQFIRLIAVPYFQNNSYFEINKRYKFSEYEHGIAGKMQGYCDIIGTDDINLTILALLLRIGNVKYYDNEKCFCGKSNISQCHLSNYRQLYLVNPETIILDLIKYFGSYNKMQTTNNYD